MNEDSYKTWLINIYRTKEGEISCTECFHWVSHYVDVELSGADAAREMPHVKLHLQQCAACRDEYETLRDLQRIDNEGASLSAGDMRDLIH